MKGIGVDCLLRFSFMVAVSLFVAGSSSCATSKSVNMRNDLWYTGIPVEVSGRPGWSDLETSRLSYIKSDMQPQAQRLLEHSELVRLTIDQAVEFLGHRPDTIPENDFYLVRSCLFNDKTGGYYISVLNGYLWVAHASLGRPIEQMKRQAILLQLAHKPQRVYVTCSVAE